MLIRHLLLPEPNQAEIEKPCNVTQSLDHCAVMKTKARLESTQDLVVM